MKPFLPKFSLLATLALTLIHSGCSKAPAETSAHDHDAHDETTAHPTPWHFVEGRGIQLSETGEKNIGLKLAEVGFAPIESFLTASARVFAAGESDNATEAKITLQLPAEKARSLAPGAHLQASLDGQSFDFAGQITRIDKTTTSAHGPAEVIARISDPDGRLETGAFLHCRIQTESADEAVIPKSSVLNTARGEFVYVQNGSYLLLTPVTVGAEGEDQVAVLDGLFEGDVVAAAGLESLWLTELQAINGGVACTHGH